MKKYFLIVCLLSLFGFVQASDDHDQSSEKKEKSESAEHHDHDEHEKEESKESDHKHPEGDDEKEHAHEGEEAGHGHGDEHGHEGEEENPQVGPNKGILEASEDKGIKLSPEAEKNFEIQKIKVTSLANVEIPKSAVVTAGVEVNLYRYRAGLYKRIDFEQLSKSGNKITIRSKDLKSGDEIAITGLGFIRIAEIAAFGGAPEGHSH